MKSTYLARYLSKFIKADAKERFIVLSGPRQSGKTTLAVKLSKNHQYFSYDNDEHKLSIKSKEWDRDVGWVILDEIHKMNSWKVWLKGIYDAEGIPPRIVVTGSARLEVYTNVGDSLAGRFFSFRLHPLDLWEVCQIDPLCNREKVLDDLLNYSGFPEPFLKKSNRFYNRWSKTHTDVILREDLLDMARIRDIQQIRLLIELLRSRVGSPISYLSLARDLKSSYKAVQQWIGLLEKLYIIFKVAPYHRNIARSLLKTPKFYFFNTAYVKGDGAKFENLVANALLKRIHYLQDVEGQEASLHYIRNKEGREVDFLAIVDNRATMLEVKLSDTKFSKDLINFKIPQFVNLRKIQLVRDLSYNRSYSGKVKMIKASDWLSKVKI